MRIRWAAAVATFVLILGGTASGKSLEEISVSIDFSGRQIYLGRSQAVRLADAIHLFAPQGAEPDWLPAGRPDLFGLQRVELTWSWWWNYQADRHSARAELALGRTKGMVSFSGMRSAGSYELTPAEVDQIHALLPDEVTETDSCDRFWQMLLAI